MQQIKGKNTTEKFRVLIFQQVLPSYRFDFFDRISRYFGVMFSVYYSPTSMGVLSKDSHKQPWAKALPPMRRLLPGIEWQPNVLSTQVRRGDIVVVWGGPRNLSNMLMLAWARLKGARTVWWGHYWSSTSKPHRFLLRLLLMKMAHAVLFYTDREVEEYRASHGKRDKRIVAALNNGIDVDPIAALRTPYDAARRDKAILFIGRVIEKAELAVLLHALADPKLHDVRLDVVGDGPEKQGVEALAKKLAIDKRIVWHGGTTDEQVIARVANTCRLFAYPGPVGLSLIHAMAYGLPAIVHDDRFRQGPEIAAFEDTETGLSFVKGDIGSLTNALIRSIDAVNELNRWSARNIDRADNVYNTASMASRFIQFVDGINHE